MARELPIWEIHGDIVQRLQTGNRLVLVAPTGSGKTTQVPQMLLDAGLAENPAPRKIVVLQPRRVAARTVAARVAWERNGRLGQEVGYQIRFEDHTSLGTRICFVTEGILLRWLQDDRTLSDVAAVVFDEFHERNLLSDVSLALVKHLQQTRRPDLKLVVMSATLDAEPVAKYLGDDCPVLVSQGISFPVELRYLDYPDSRPAAEQAADAVERVVNSGEAGDILVFMPGMGEIQSTINALRSARLSERVAFLPLHGDLAPEDQDLAFAPNPNRKVVVATNVAETSVTIDGIRHVVDAGLARVARYDAERGINTLLLEEISRASADQRKGRAGRTAPGVCWRLWTESGHLNRPERNTPEIQRADLAEVVLLLHSLGIKRAAEFDWLDKPDPQAVVRAEKLLVTLGALRESASQAGEGADAQTSSDLTPIGRQMLRLPMHPRYSRMLVEAAAQQCVPAAALCAALVSGRDLLMRLSRDDTRTAELREIFEASQDSDFFTLMRAWTFARNNHFSVEACRRHGIHAQTARQIAQTYEQILDVAKRQGLLPRERGATGSEEAGDDAGKELNNAKPVSDDALTRCLTAGFIDQLAARRDKGTLECELTGGRTGTLMRESVVQNAPLLVVGSIREVESRGSGNLTLLGMATAVKREWLTEMFPQHIHEQVEHLFDRAQKRVAAVKLVRFEDLVIHHEHQRELDPVASGRCIAEAYAKGYFELPLLNHEIRQFIARVNLVHAAMPELEYPCLDDAALVACLTRAFHGLSLVKEAQAMRLNDAFAAHLAPEQVGWLNELAPTAIPWLADKKLKLSYSEGANAAKGEAEAPEAQVKLHECFALAEHPRICEGTMPVKLWLCSPDGKRLEPTLDWPKFKANQYPKLKPALQKKFPGQMWL
ncbi:MAG TPA: ATP-dependent helicase C-terminal domain-containing protein [Verrucomicrobiae bacterium]|nr:ATP-dependent helicase C-terminal domain-containing protein [Verrucomicrobiae bacterium]